MFRIRAGSQDDLERMYQLDVLCFAPVFRFSRAAMQRFAQGRNRNTFIAEDESGVMAGFLILSLHPKDDLAYIITLDVAPAYRGRGVARQLIHVAEMFAASDLMSSMQLHVYTSNEQAIQLYSACGYQQVRREDDFYGGDLDALLLSKPI